MSQESDRTELLNAFHSAVDGEIRFGNRLDVRADLDERWRRVIDSIERLCLKTPRKK